MDPIEKFRQRPTPSQMCFALPLELKEQFARVCAENDVSASQKIRHLMSRFVRENQKEETAH